jgi:hypothetical protein
MNKSQKISVENEKNRNSGLKTKWFILRTADFID